MRVDVTGLDVQLGARPIVSDVHLSVASGTVYGLLGPNGCGKSTLLRAVAGITPPPPGRVHYDGKDITSFPRKDVARRVAVMAQEHSEEFEIPVLDLVLLARIPHGKGFGRDSEHDLEIAHDSLRRVGAAHLAHRPFCALSGGERQRVLFARALTQETPVLVLDEPTNHLDIAHQLELLDMVRATECTVLVALHDLNLAARSCDALGVLKDGRLVCHGAPHEILDTDLIRTVFDVESTAVAHPASGTKHFLFDARSPREQPAPSRSQEGITIS